MVIVSGPWAVYISDQVNIIGVSNKILFSIPTILCIFCIYELVWPFLGLGKLYINIYFIGTGEKYVTLKCKLLDIDKKK